MPRKTSSRGFTLIEMLIAVTLVSAIVTGLLMTMRTALTAYQKVNLRLEDNRRVMGLDHALHEQLGGMMPVTSQCPAGGAKVSVFSGSSAWMRFISSSSLSEGARGYPRIVEYAVAPDPDGGGVRLMMTERLYTGPASLAPLCADGNFVPVQVAGDSVEMAGKLAYCRFAYRKPIPDSPLGGDWLPAWQDPNLPRAVRMEMMPIDSGPTHLPRLTINFPVRVTRLMLNPYADEAR